MVQIIPKDIHIRKWEKFQVDVQLKFLTWSFYSLWMVHKRSGSHYRPTIKIYFIGLSRWESAACSCIWSQRCCGWKIIDRAKIAPRIFASLCFSVRGGSNLLSLFFIIISTWGFSSFSGFRFWIGESLQWFRMVLTSLDTLKPFVFGAVDDIRSQASSNSKLILN